MNDNPCNRTHYTRRDIAVLAFLAGVLTGALFTFSACTGEVLNSDGQCVENCR